MTCPVQPDIIRWTRPAVLAECFLIGGVAHQPHSASPLRAQTCRLIDLSFGPQPQLTKTCGESFAKSTGGDSVKVAIIGSKMPFRAGHQSYGGSAGQDNAQSGPDLVSGRLIRIDLPYQPSGIRRFPSDPCRPAGLRDISRTFQPRARGTAWIRQIGSDWMHIKMRLAGTGGAAD